jgi:acyl-CoA thioester hydrolase
MALRHALPKLSDYPVHETERLRFGDLDTQGHVNNVAFAELLESGRIYFFRDTFRPALDPHQGTVVARVVIDYLGELHWPGEVTIGTGVTRIGRSSVGIRQGLFDGDRCAALCESVIVVIDHKQRTSSPMPDRARAALETFMMPTDAAGETAQ